MPARAAGCMAKAGIRLVENGNSNKSGNYIKICQGLPQKSSKNKRKEWTIGKKIDIIASYLGN